MSTVYLAGPIAGCNDEEASGWRQGFVEAHPAHEFLDPMRRDYRGKEDDNVNDIVELDIEDIDTADIFLAYCWQVSWGTAMEIFYAYTSGKRVILVVPEGVRVSPWLRYHSDEIYKSLDDVNLGLEVQGKTYLAGPMRGYPAFNFPAFLEAADALRHVGWEVCNPAERDIAEHGEAIMDSETGDLADIAHLGFDLHEAMRYDLGFIVNEADAVFVLPGWEASSGARTEVTTAQALGIPVYEYPSGVGIRKVVVSNVEVVAGE